MSALKALIFDVDGTLAETEEAHRRAFNETFAAQGLDWEWSRDLYRDLLRVTGGKERMAAYQRDHRGETPDPARIAALHAEKTERYAEILRTGGLALRPGVAALMAAARADGVRLAIATTTSRPNVERLSECCFGAPAADMFEVIAAGDEVAAKKPAPDVYLLALKRLDLPASACVALEDSANGAHAARAAGIACIACPSAYTSEDDLSAAQAIVQSFDTVAGLDAARAALMGETA